jgi:MPBQ/MSBQ methyltransferase
MTVEVAPPIVPAEMVLQKQHVMRKLSAGSLAKGIASRLFWPGHLWTAFSLHWNRKANRRKFDDTRLALYSQILPSDFLHYGFFDDVNQAPEEMSLHDITRAQSRYAELLIDLAGDKADPVLDIGCGMGGLSRMLKDRGYAPTALTPDRMQAAHVLKNIPDVPVLRMKLEKMPAADYAGKFGTVFTAESLQYLKLDQALPILQTILKPGGKWVACDYFLARPSTDPTCHNWEMFNHRLEEAGWRITYERDITPNVLPTLGFLHMLSTRFGMPILGFVTLRLKRKQPGIHHLVEKAIDQLQGVADDNIALINPIEFAKDRKYMMLVMERIS